MALAESVEVRVGEERGGREVLFEDSQEDDGEGGEEGVEHGEGPGFVERGASVAEESVSDKVEIDIHCQLMAHPFQC